MVSRNPWHVDTWVRCGCALIVAAVAASPLSSTNAVALRGGADPTNAMLWPLSVDGLLLLAMVGLLKPGHRWQRECRRAHGGRGLADFEALSGDPLRTWRDWATDVTGHGIDSGHHVAEHTPADLTAVIAGFRQSRPPAQVRRQPGEPESVGAPAITTPIR
jgi:hypothetical protein